MIVIDTSALIAIFLKEVDGVLFEDAISEQRRCCISAVSVHETVTVLRVRQGAAAVDALLRFLRQNTIEIVPFDEAQVRAAATAFDRFGKGIHPRARLNICDCAAYALAKTRDAPLLFKGDDFSHTDILAAV